MNFAEQRRHRHAVGDRDENGGSTVPTVLHLDDDPNDAELFRAAVVKAGARFVVHSTDDSDEAMAYLTGKGPYAVRSRYPMPALLLLDLKMPRSTGLEILEWIRAQPELARLPVVVLSGSEMKEDMTKARSFGADSYLVKPLGFDNLVKLAEQIERNWLR
jgi:CheY-like chemotaxis protein